MPYRHAHLVLAAVLAPLILLAFWRDYFGVMRSASLAFHAHGLTAIAWLGLLAAQSWTIHARRPALHRTWGRALFVVVPLFVAGGVLVIQSMAVKFVGGHPFYGVFGARLGLLDIYMTTVLVAMVAAALRHRRRVGLHAGYMLGTALLVVPPVMARLPAPQGYHLGELLPMAIALALAARYRRDSRPMLIVTAALAGQIVLFHTLGASAAWGRAFAALATVGPIPLAGAAILAAALALLALLAAWRPALRPVAPARPAV